AGVDDDGVEVALRDDVELVADGGGGGGGVGKAGAGGGLGPGRSGGGGGRQRRLIHAGHDAAIEDQAVAVRIAGVGVEGLAFPAVGEAEGALELAGNGGGLRVCGEGED